MNADKAEVLATNESFYRAFEKKDIKAMGLVWSQGTGSLCIHPGGSILRGWQDIQTSWEKIFRHTDYLEIETEIITIEVGSSIAYVVLVENILQMNRGRKLEAQSLATNTFLKMAPKVVSPSSPR